MAHLSGEGHVAGLTSLVEELAAEHEAKGTLHRGSGPYVPPAPVARDLKFPGKAIALGDRGTEPGLDERQHCGELRALVGRGEVQTGGAADPVHHQGHRLGGGPRQRLHR